MIAIVCGVRLLPNIVRIIIIYLVAIILLGMLAYYVSNV